MNGKPLADTLVTGRLRSRPRRTSGPYATARVIYAVWDDDVIISAEIRLAVLAKC